MHRSWRYGWLVVAAVVLPQGVARAQATGGDKAAAEALYEEARSLMDAGRWADACPKLVESQRLDAGVGTLLHLANCYEKTKRFASAWATFKEASAAAQSAGQADRRKLADERAAELVPRLSKLVIEVPSTADVPGLEVKRNGATVGRPLWGVPIPVDAGQQSVTASAPGKKTFTKAIDVSQPGTVTLTVTDLATELAAPPPSAPKPQAEGGLGTRRTLAIVAGGVGVVGVGVGSFFGFRTKSKWDEAQTHCRDTRCDATGVGLADDAKSAGTLSTIFFAGGIAALGTGAALWLIQPTERAQPTSVAASPLPGGGAIAVGGAW